MRNTHFLRSRRFPLIPMAFKITILAVFPLVLVPAPVHAESTKHAAEVPRPTEPDIERRIAEILKERKIVVHWKYTPEIIPVHIRDNGFIEKYASIDRDEEFAVLSQYLFAAPEEMKKLMEKYPAIRIRASLAIHYYKAISEKIDLSVYDDLLVKE